MAVTHTISGGPWPQGSTVTAYTRLGIGPILDLAVPPGSTAVDAATVSQDMLAVFDGLDQGQAYWAVGQDSAGRWRWVSFKTFIPDGITDGAIALQEIADHEADPAAAHPASAISVGPDGNVAAALQAVIDSVGSRIYARQLDFGSMGATVQVDTTAADALLGVTGELSANVVITIPDLLPLLFVLLDLTQPAAGGPFTVTVPQMAGGTISLNTAAGANTVIPLISPDGQRLVALTTGSDSTAHPLTVSEIATTVVTGA